MTHLITVCALDHMFKSLITFASRQTQHVNSSQIHRMECIRVNAPNEGFI